MTTNQPKEKKLSQFQASSVAEAQFLLGYMEGFHKFLKSPQERLYAARRSEQLVFGHKRPVGMSASTGIAKARVRPLEIVIRKVWKAGLAKLEIQKDLALTELMEELEMAGSF